MNSKTLLQHMATTYLNHGPQRRRQDAATLLSMLEALDEEGARIYMERFVNKWQLLPEANEPPPMRFVRRRPMAPMEQQVAAKLIAGESPTQESKISVEIDHSEHAMG